MDIIRPLHPLLQPYIDFFYFSPSIGGPASYVAFPHVNTCLSFFRNCQITINEDEIEIGATVAGNNNICAFITGRYTYPVYVRYSAPIHEIAIVFKPLGLQHFIDHPTRHVHRGAGAPFDEKNWLSMAATLVDGNDANHVIDQLETFLVQELRQTDLAAMYTALLLLEDAEEDYTIDELAKAATMSRKTLERHFLKELGCTPASYKRILRFRRSVNLGLIKKEIGQLTSIAYNANYYDQSYFIREYKKLTHSNPKAFFERIRTFEANKIVWMPR